jgi:hypothetical protein
LNTDKLDVSLEAVHIDEDIDPCIGKYFHASTVVRERIDMIDSDGVGPKIFHQSSVKLALVRVDQRIVGNKLIGNACK